MNKIIRKKAFELYKKHWRFLLPMFFVQSLFGMAATAIFMLLPELGLWSNIIRILISALFSPFIHLGFCNAMLQIWNGAEPKLSMFTKYVTSKSSYLQAFLFKMYFQIISFIIFLPINLLNYIKDSAIKPALFVLLSPIITALSIWFICKTFLAVYLYTTGVFTNPKSALWESASRTKGSCLSLMWFCISIFWLPICIAYIIIGLLHAVLSSSIIIIIFSLLFIPFSPYFGLAIAGFASNLLPSAKELSKMKKEYTLKEQIL